MSFHANDTEAALQECSRLLGDAQPSVSSAIEEAKALYARGMSAEALDVAVDALRKCSCDASTLLSRLETARSHLRAQQVDVQLNATTKELDAVRHEVHQLKKGMSTLMKERDQAVSRRSRQRRKELLGQLAFTLALSLIHI